MTQIRMTNDNSATKEAPTPNNELTHLDIRRFVILASFVLSHSSLCCDAQAREFKSVRLRNPRPSWSDLRLEFMQFLQSLQWGELIKV
jgi:hypothetical protein